MKNVGRGPLECGEAGVKVRDNDLGLMTWKSGEKTSLSRDEILLARIEVASLKPDHDGKIAIYLIFAL